MDTTTSSSQVLIPVDRNNPTNIGITGVIPISYNNGRNRVVWNDDSPKNLPRTGEQRTSLLLTLIGGVIFLCGIGLYFYQVRGDVDEKN